MDYHREPKIISKAEQPEQISGTFTFVEYQNVYKNLFNQDLVKAVEMPPSIYKRYGYPELAEKEREISEIVGVEKDKVVLYNSGMAAIRDSIESLALTQGDVLLYSPAMYEQTVEYIEKDLRQRGVKIIPVKVGDINELPEQIKRNHPQAIIMETVGNAPEMPVVDIELTLQKIEQTNQSYQQEKNLAKILKNLLINRPWIKGWLKIEVNQQTELTKEQEEKLADLIRVLEQSARKVNQLQSAVPLRAVVRKLKSEGITVNRDELSLAKLKSIIDTAWLAKREKPISVILDNTLPSPAGLALGQIIEKSSVPVIAVESGTKYYAHDIGTMGIAYTNFLDKALELKLLRMRSGTYLPGAVQKILPELNKQTFNERNKVILHNTKLLAEALNDLSGNLGIKAVSYPNLPHHSNYQKAMKQSPEGASGVFYVLCENSMETAKILAERLGEGIEFGGSFGFDKTRFLPLPDGVLRIAGGNESQEELKVILDKIIELA